MLRFSFLALLFLLAMPAFAKPYPNPCNDLWSAVTDTLNNPGHYKIIAADDEQMKASFVVVGSLFPGTHFLSLKRKDNGCELQTRMAFTGTDEDYALRRRINHAVAKRKAAKPSPLAPSAPPSPAVGLEQKLLHSLQSRG